MEVQQDTTSMAAQKHVQLRASATKVFQTDGKVRRLNPGCFKKGKLTHTNDLTASDG